MNGFSSRLRVRGRTIVDGTGRDVLLRGIGIVEKWDPYLPPVGADDLARIRSWGMNSVRLGTVWEAIEPEPDAFDDVYLDAFAEITRQAAAAGLYVIVDLHQDLFAACFGGDGAPAWAAQTSLAHIDLRASGIWGLNYLSPAVNEAFTRFWTSAWLQRHYADVLRKLAERLAGNEMVVGYDLINEPHPGFIPPGVFETAFLYPSQARWLRALRDAHPDAIGFVEPPITKNAHALTVPMLRPPPNSVYSPHLYGFWDELPGTAAPLRASLAHANLRYSQLEARVMGTPIWVGEFGMRHDAPDVCRFLRSAYDGLDRIGAGAAYWAYGCGTGYSPLDADGSPRPTLSEIVRAYPAAVPGLTGWTFDAQANLLTARWTGEGDALFAVPQLRYPDGITVQSDGAWSWDRQCAQLRVAGGSSLVLSPA